MRSQPEGRHAKRQPPERPQRVARVGWATSLVLALIVIVASVYLQPYVDEPTRFPHGIDTSVYMFRSGLVHDVGLSDLHPFGERPAHPIVTSVLRDISGGAPLDLARIWPALFALAIGLAGAALGAGVAGERRWVAAALGVGLAASPFVALTAIGYASNLLLDVFAVAAVALAVRVGTGGRGAVALVLLIGAAAISHWLFATMLTGLLVAYAAGLYLFRRVRRRAEDPSPRQAGRLFAVVLLGALLGVLVLLASPELPDRIPSSKQDAAEKIAARVPEMRLAITIPLAGAGAAILLVAGRAAARRAAAPLVMWALAAPAGLVAWKVLDMTIPHRIVPFALGIPALIVLGAAAIGSATDARRSPVAGGGWAASGGWGVASALVSAVLVLAAAGWLARSGGDTWSKQRAGFTTKQVEQALVVSAYLETVPAGTRVIVPVGGGPWRPLRALQVALPAERFLSVSTWRVNFVGDTRGFRRRLAARYPAGTVAIYLASYSQQPPLEGTRLGPGVTLLVGPDPPGPLSVGSVARGDAGDLIRLTAVSLAAVAVVGLGWTLLLTALPAFAAVCLSPAIGMAVVAIGGLAAGRLGMPLGRGGGVLTALWIGTLGWMAFAVRSRSPSRTSDGHHVDEAPSAATLVPSDDGRGGRHVARKGRVRDE
jgi:hypothetical protein